MHDLRNPLAAIYGRAEMMVDTELSQPRIKRVAGNIYRASRRIQQMLQDLLDLSKGRAGSREVCSIREVVDAAVEAYAAESERHGVRVEVSVPEDLEARFAL